MYKFFLAFRVKKLKKEWKFNKDMQKVNEKYLK